MQLTRGELTVLGLLIEQPRHAYDLERVVAERGIREWTDIGFSSIYYILGKLKDRGLVQLVGDECTAKRRRVFEVTASGQEAASDAVRALAESSREAPHPLLLALANRDLLGDVAFRTAFAARRDALGARIAAIEAARDAQPELPIPAEEVFSFATHMLRAEQSWIERRIGAST